MDKHKRDIQLFLSINHHRNVQINRKRANEIMYNGHKIYYNSYENPYGNNHILIIDGGRDSGRRPCFTLTIENNLAILQSLERGDDCFIDRHNKTKDLVHVAFQIAKQNGCTEFELTDNAILRCPPYKFNLSDIYFLTTGQTWYESIIPITIKSLLPSQILEYRNRAKKNKWSTISKYLLSIGAKLDFISTEDIDVNKIGSALTVLNRIKQMKNTISCKFFATYTESILFASNIPSFYAKTWIYKEQ